MDSYELYSSSCLDNDINTEKYRDMDREKKRERERERRRVVL